ncbi:uncharacterized protein LOC144457826 isoform X2 [Phascolarctos cinereus]
MAAPSEETVAVASAPFCERKEILPTQTGSSTELRKSYQRNASERKIRSMGDFKDVQRGYSPYSFLPLLFRQLSSDWRLRKSGRGSAPACRPAGSWGAPRGLMGQRRRVFPFLTRFSGELFEELEFRVDDPSLERVSWKGNGGAVWRC